MKSKIVLMISFIMLLGFYNIVFSQRMVLSPTYNTMLKGMLSHSVSEKSVSDIDKMIRTKSVLVLDTREKEEYNVSHLLNSVWVGFEDFEMPRVPKTAYSDTIIVYCSVGYRSEKIAERLKSAGFKNVINMYGGIFEWVNQGFSVYTSSNEKTQKIHAFNKTWGIWLEKGEKVY